MQEFEVEATYLHEMQPTNSLCFPKVFIPRTCHVSQGAIAKRALYHQLHLELLLLPVRVMKVSLRETLLGVAISTSEDY